MTKTRSTKRALLMSALALLMCVSMLIGSTFAWFTDSVTSAGNKIQSGTLKLDLELYDTENKIWNSIKEDKTAIFDYDLWEPGYTEVQLLKVENEGNLALKWIAKFVSEDDLSILADVIDVYVKAYGVVDESDVSYPENRSLEGYTRVGTVAEFVNTIEKTTYGSLKAGESAYLGIGLKMQESAGNDYQGLDLGGAFDIMILATQDTVEADSFGTDYDANAEYPIVPEPVEVNSTISFADFAALMESGNGNIYLTENITVANPENSRFTEFELKGNVGIYATEGAKLTFAETTTLTGNGTLTVYGGSIDEKQELCVADNATLVFEAGEHNFAAFSVARNGTIVVNGGTLNCNGTYAGILGICFAENGKLIVNDGTLNMYQPFNLNQNRCDTAYIEINGGNINLDENVDKLFAVRNIMDKDRESGVLRGSSIRINGGIFTATYMRDDTGDANAFIRNEDGSADSTRVLASTTFNGQPDYDCVVTGGTFYGDWARTGETGDVDFCENTIAGFVANG